ncbi:MAG: Stp1/IreP family PP2C-type Ser/Thr phosphatase [Myxococcaceae bacterium]
MGAPAERAPVRLKAASAGLTDVGRKRDHNEDSFLIDEELQLYVVADGMGGHAGGGTASRIAVETIDKRLRDLRAAEPRSPAPANLQDSAVPETIRTAVEQACLAIFAKAQEDPELAGMGTTVISLLLDDAHAFFAHVGDSRAYLVRGELIQQISEDHSLVNEQIKAGMITPEEARHSRYRNIITRSVGFEEEVQVDVMGLLAEPGDVFILCSDGLANMLEDTEILEIVRANTLGEIPAKLIELANERGGDDNITVIAVRAELDDGPESRTSRVVRSP